MLDTGHVMRGAPRDVRADARRLAPLIERGVLKRRHAPELQGLHAGDGRPLVASARRERRESRETQIDYVLRAARVGPRDFVERRGLPHAERG